MNDQPISLQKKCTEAINQYAEVVKQRDELKFQLDKARHLLKQIELLDFSQIGMPQVTKEKIRKFLEGK